MLSFLRFWFPLLTYSAIITYVSGIPSLHAPNILPFSDKFFHFGEYLVFGFLAVRAFMHQVTENSVTRYLAIGFSCTLIFALSDEIHQSFVPGRSSDIADLAADCVGGVLGALTYYLFIRYTRKSI